MATIGLTAGFTLIPEGKYIFKITDCEYKTKFGKIEVKLEMENGMKHTERYDVNKEGGLNAFSYFAKTALNDYDLKEIDPTAVIGHFIECEVVHTTLPHRNDPNKTITFVNLKDKYPASGFSGEFKAPVPTEKTETATDSKYDLSFLDN